MWLVCSHVNIISTVNVSICEINAEVESDMNAATKTREKSAVPTLQRGIAILEHLARRQQAATTAELVEQLGYPSASIFRITQELEQLGYLSRDPVTKKHSLTNKFLLLGQPKGNGGTLTEASLAAMRQLNRETGETTQLCCLVDTRMVIIEQLIATHAFKYSAQIGASCPAYSCAPGKILIAHLPDDEQQELIGRLKFKAYTPTTITTAKAFRQEMKRIVDCGYAVDQSEGLEGIHCVAAPIRDRHGYPVGAITVAAPASRIPKARFAEVGKLVAELTAIAEAEYRLQ